LAIENIGFTTGYRFEVAGVDEINVEASLFKNIIEGDPIDGGRLHRDSINVA